MTDRAEQPRRADSVPDAGERPIVNANTTIDASQLLSSSRLLQPVQESKGVGLFPSGGISRDGSVWFDKPKEGDAAGPVGGPPGESARMKFDPKAPPEGQLTKFAELYANGTKDKHGNVKAEIDIDGKPHTVSISREKMGSANLMQVRDAEGHLMMRGQERNGEWQHQRTANGTEASYFGKFYEQGGQPKPEVQPRAERKPAPGEKLPPHKDKAEQDKPPGTPLQPDSSPVVKSWNNVELTAYFNGRGAGRGEGGTKDQNEKPLYSVQQFLKDPSRPVSVAVDRNHMPHYGEKLSIPELDRKYANELNQLVADGKLKEPKFQFTAVDNGPAVRGKHHVDICLAKYKSEQFPDEHLSYNATVNILARDGARLASRSGA
jgi:hypothetical protein